MDRLLNLDAVFSQHFILPPESNRRQLAKFTAHLGDGPHVFGGLGLIYLIGWFNDGIHLCQNVLVIVLTILAAIIAVTLIKFIVRRQRPQPPGEFVTFQYDVYSFPSGHSARLAALAVSTIFFDPLLGWILVVIALSVAAARVAVGVHYVGDIVVGLGVGALVAWEGNSLLPYIFG